MFVGCLQQANNLGPLESLGLTTSLKISAHSTAKNVLIDLADIYEELTLLGTAVVPVFAKFVEAYVVSSEALRPS
jgi:hypothetical protein